MSVGGGLGEIFVNHDARLHISPDHALPQLLEAYKRSKVLSNLLLLAGGVSGILAFQRSKDQTWIVGSGLILGKSCEEHQLSKNLYIFILSHKYNDHSLISFLSLSVSHTYCLFLLLFLAGVPYCFLVEDPVIDQLKYLTLEAKSEKAKSLVASWYGIQLGKLALATSGTIIFYWFCRR